jgi:hypothetical protein
MASDTLMSNGVVTWANWPIISCMARTQAVARRLACLGETFELLPDLPPGAGKSSKVLISASSNQQMMVSPLKPMTLPP